MTDPYVCIVYIYIYIYGLPFAINKKKRFISIYTIRLDPMGMGFFVGTLRVAPRIIHEHYKTTSPSALILGLKSSPEEHKLSLMGIWRNSSDSTNYYKSIINPMIIPVYLHRIPMSGTRNYPIYLIPFFYPDSFHSIGLDDLKVVLSICLSSDFLGFLGSKFLKQFNFCRSVSISPM